MTHHVPKKARLMGRFAKVCALLSDIQYALADGELDVAEELLEALSDAESFVTVAPCRGYRRAKIKGGV